MKSIIILKLLFFIIICSYNNANAQSEILLINGKVLNKKVLSIDENTISIEKNNKTKQIKISDIFSITNNEKQESILYKPEPELGLTLNTENMRSFVYGEKWGRENFKAPMSTVFGFVAGAVGGYYQFYGTPIPIIASVALGSIGPKSKHYERFSEEYKSDIYFGNGFKDYAKKKKTANAFKGGFVGFFASTVLVSYLSSKDW